MKIYLLVYEDVTRMEVKKYVLLFQHQDLNAAFLSFKNVNVHPFFHQK